MAAPTFLPFSLQIYFLENLNSVRGVSGSNAESLKACVFMVTRGVALLREEAKAEVREALWARAITHKMAILRANLISLGVT